MKKFSRALLLVAVIALIVATSASAASTTVQNGIPSLDRIYTIILPAVNGFGVREVDTIISSLYCDISQTLKVNTKSVNFVYDQHVPELTTVNAGKLSLFGQLNDGTWGDLSNFRSFDFGTKNVTIAFAHQNCKQIPNQFYDPATNRITCVSVSDYVCDPVTYYINTQIPATLIVTPYLWISK